jgi:imidazole glycerol-phosphate synthase subunit HisH
VTEQPRVAVVDYGAGNMVSIVHALERAGAVPIVAEGPAGLAGVAAVVVPGVGASGPAMRSLRRRGLDRALERAVANGAHFLGVCLGLQLLFERSAEDGAAGLGWLRGTVRPLPDAPRLPHVGWNLVEPVARHPLFPGRTQEAFYFVHSYAPAPEHAGIVLAETAHGGRFVSAIACGPLVGVQFHPEKSGRDGLRFLQRWVQLVVGTTRTVA